MNLYEELEWFYRKGIKFLGKNEIEELRFLYLQNKYAEEERKQERAPGRVLTVECLNRCEWTALALKRKAKELLVTVKEVKEFFEEKTMSKYPEFDELSLKDLQELQEAYFDNKQLHADYCFTLRCNKNPSKELTEEYDKSCEVLNAKIQELGIPFERVFEFYEVG